ncbi:MAG: cell wall hydrolase [Tenericutes bacterium]|nr:cell wall hydrolase [Mycoplasmatota bacterium]
MMLVQYTSKELDLLARLIRAEAVGEGELGMLMVGNVIVNRTIADCLTFKNNRTITDTVYQSPGGFAGVNSNLFYSTATTTEKELASRVLRGEYYYPATNALWFYAPTGNNSCVALWYDQELAGRYKSHCFYKPYPNVCSELH